MVTKLTVSAKLRCSHSHVAAKQMHTGLHVAVIATGSCCKNQNGIEYISLQSGLGYLIGWDKSIKGWQQITY